MYLKLIEFPWLAEKVLLGMRKCIEFVTSCLNFRKIIFSFFCPVYSQKKCQKRYRQSFHHYNRQFRHEIKQLEAMQSSAIDAMRVHR